MSAQTLQDLVDSLYEDFGGFGDYSEGYILDWVLDNSNLGKLNYLIGSSFSGNYLLNPSGIITGGTISPDMGGEESSIYQKLFECAFCQKQVRETLYGVAGRTTGSSSDWISLKEGDSQITRLNRNEVLKSAKAAQRDCQTDLEFMVLNYLKYKNSAEQVLSEDYDRYL